MDDQFKDLSQQEIDLMINTPVLITILIAGADNDIDPDEQKWAKKLTTYRQFTEKPILQDYYKTVSENFESNLEKFVVYINSFPQDAKERNPHIAQELEKLNDILTKLDDEFSTNFYESIKSFAQHIAEASGGVLGFGSISPEEKAWVDLSMIKNPAAISN
ncbi:MAG: hypothetical protein COC01_08645 [Bacteroidetes bacterium]|nr:MAG: hypothetical protein COC01_08645 [Bacteroidota bacterium]